jgi:curli production assembly/transport component CsgF
MKQRHWHCLALAGLCMGAVQAAGATEMVFGFLNPSFGGNPLNGSVLLSSASATNKHIDAANGIGAAAQESQLQQFNDILERSILSQLSTAASSKLISNGQLIPGTLETGNFKIDISDLGGGMLRVTTTDKATGSSTSFEVGQ